MRKFIFAVALVFSVLGSSAQIDTIYSGSKRIPCTVVEVAADVVKFTYPDETMLNSLFVNSINKIVFKSGRVQQFAAQNSFRTIKSPADWENVSLASVESEIRGLYKLGEVSSKAAGTTELSNQERVKMRAIRKLKMDAAMMGANIIYVINMRSEGNKMDWSGNGSSQAAETSITGVSYTNAPIEFAEMQHFLASHAGRSMVARSKFTLRKGDSDMRITDIDTPFRFSNVVNESGTVFVEGIIDGAKTDRFQVVFLSADGFCLRYSDKSAVYVYKIII
ncbi:MAG: hypothetical protein RSD75_04605 [Mucinivorans sp.]